MKVDADLPLVQPCILQRVVHLAEVFVRVAHVAVPQPHLFLLLDAEHAPHLLLQLLCKTCAMNLEESRHTHTDTFSNTVYFKTTKLIPSSLVSRTSTPARTPRLHQRAVMCDTVMWGLSSAITSSLHDSIHPPEMEINPPNTAYGCPLGRIIEKTKSHINPLTMWNACVNVQLHIPGDPSVQHCNTTIKQQRKEQGKKDKSW